MLLPGLMGGLLLGGSGGGGGGGSDPHFANVVFLSHFDGSDGATTATDLSNSGHSITFNGNAQIDTAIADPFGGNGGVLMLDGSGDFVSIADHADFEFGTGLWTVEGWFRFTRDANEALICKWSPSSSQRSWQLFQSGPSNEVVIWHSSDGSNAFVTSGGTAAPALEQWHHIAGDYDGTDIRVYVGGAMVVKKTVSLSLHDGTAPLTIGARDNGQFLDGHVGPCRITKGVARYASDAGYTVPTAPFPDS